ncbi:MAG: dienelactone hydrolase family protein [Chloroflexi bacterium]|nr:MAG: dienelactone hydrolase family protein [Chloroflexota bacterium]
MSRLFKRIGLGLLITLASALLLLFGSLLVDGLLGPGRLDNLTNMRVTAADGTEIRAYLAKPAGEGPFPAVIMLHEFYGLRAEMIGKADALAQEGYLVIAPNVFRSGTTNWIPRAIYNVITADPAQIDGDVDAAYRWLAAQPDVQADRIGVMGFCFGGGTALRYSLSNPALAATAIFYGQIIADPAQLARLSGPVLGIFGGADQSIPLTEVEALRQGLEVAAIPHEITVYEGQPHAFVQGVEEIAQGGPQQAAWQQLLAFLQRTLKEGPAAGVTPVAHSASVRGEIPWRYLFWLALSHAGHL